MKQLHCINSNVREHGAILFIVAASLFILIGFLGLAFDLGHMYNNKSLLQNMADSCALAGGSALDGTSAGIQLATDRARDALGRLSNKTEFNSISVTLAESDVSFSTQLNGTYVDKATAQGDAANIRYVRVVIPPQTSEIFFAKLIPGIPVSLNFGAEAIAGQNPQSEVCSGLDPFSPQALGPAPNFGYSIGTYYALRQPTGSDGNQDGNGNAGGGGGGGGCDSGGNPNGQDCPECKNGGGPQPGTSSVCDDVGITGSIGGNFGLSDPTFGGPNTTCFRDVVVNGSYNSCVKIEPAALPTTPGNKGINVQRAMQARFCQDTVKDSPISHDAYVDAGGNGRRVIRVAFNDGVPMGHSTYNVVGFGCFFMVSCPRTNPPSTALCLQYIGPCDNTGNPSGNGSPSITKLVLFR